MPYDVIGKIVTLTALYIFTTIPVGLFSAMLLAILFDAEITFDLIIRTAYIGALILFIEVCFGLVVI